MTPQRLVEVLGPASVPVWLAAVAGLLFALGAAGAWGAGRRLPAGVAVAAVGLPAAVLWATLPAPTDLDALTVNASLRLMAPVVLGMPAGALLLFTGLFSALRGPRRVVAPAVGLAAVLAVAGVVFASGRAIDETVFAPARAVAYALVGVFAAVGLMAGDPQRGIGGECAVAAGVAFAAIVLAGEGAGLAIPEVVMALNLQGVAVDARPAFIDAFLAESVTIAAPWAWGAAAASGVFVVAAISAGLAEPRRIALALAATLWLAPGLATIASTPARAAWVRAGEALPPPAPVVPTPDAPPTPPTPASAEG